MLSAFGSFMTLYLVVPSSIFHHWYAYSPRTFDFLLIRHCQDLRLLIADIDDRWSQVRCALSCCIFVKTLIAICNMIMTSNVWACWYRTYDHWYIVPWNSDLRFVISALPLVLFSLFSGFQRVASIYSNFWSRSQFLDFHIPLSMERLWYSFEIFCGLEDGFKLHFSFSLWTTENTFGSEWQQTAMGIVFLYSKYEEEELNLLFLPGLYFSTYN